MMNNSLKPLPAVAARLGIIAARRAVTKGSGLQETANIGAVVKIACEQPTRCGGHER